MRGRRSPTSQVARARSISPRRPEVLRSKVSRIKEGKGVCRERRGPLPADSSPYQRSIPAHRENWWTWSGSNRRPLPCHGSALPAAPQAHLRERNSLGSEFTLNSERNHHHFRLLPRYSQPAPDDWEWLSMPEGRRTQVELRSAGQPGRLSPHEHSLISFHRG